MSAMSRWRKLGLAGCVLFGLALAGLAGVIAGIRSGLERCSREAAERFPGDRIQALIAVVDCESCPPADRNHAVWALGQMEAAPALATLKRRYDGWRCLHADRICQYELRKAIRMIERRDRRNGRLARLIRSWHQPWK